MLDIMLKDRDGNPLNYEGISALRLQLAGGGTKDILFDNSDSGSSGTAAEKKPFRFYDPYGNVIYEYSYEEIQALEELPEGPELETLTFYKWTHTLEDLKSLLYFADVGPVYRKNGNPVTILVVETLFASTSVALSLRVPAATVNIAWELGAEIKHTFSGSSLQPLQTASYTYADAGQHIITITSSYDFSFGGYSNSYYVGPTNIYMLPGNTTKSTISSDINIRCIVGGENLSSLNGVRWLGNLRFLSIPNQSYFSAYDFWFSYSLKAIAAPAQKISGANSLYMCTRLKRIFITEGTGSNFGDDSALEEVMYSSTDAITSEKMNSKWAMLLLAEIPPEIKATSPSFGTKPIYVPDPAVDTYKTAAGWSNVADYIFPASKYHSN